jgi:hypothetical protein
MELEDIEDIQAKDEYRKRFLNMASNKNRLNET